METKEILIIGGVGVVLAVGAYIVIKKMGDMAPAQTAVEEPAKLPAYNPVITAYTPVGLNAPGSNAGSPPPGVHPDEVDLVKVKAPAQPNLPAPNLGDHGPSNAPPHGTAIQSTGTTADHVSALPALTGDAAMIDAEYVKLFGRHAEQSALDNWQKEFAGGYTHDQATIEKRLINNAGSVDIAAAVMNQPYLVIKYDTNA